MRDFAEKSECTNHLRDFDPFDIHRDDPFTTFKEARRSCPIFYSHRIGAWCVTRYHDIVLVLTNRSDFSVREHNPRPTAHLTERTKQVMAAWRGKDALPLGSLDPPEHDGVRTSVGTVFSPEAVASLEPQIRSLARDLLPRLNTAGDSELLTAFCLPYALAVILTALGIEGEDPQRFHTWTEQRVRLMTAPAGTDADELELCAEGLLEYGRFADELVARRLAEPGDDAISRLLAGNFRANPMTAAQVRAHIPTLITAGYRTAAEALATTVDLAARDPRRWRTLVSGEVPPAALVKEALRYDCPITGMYRTALTDTTVGNTLVRAGDRVLLLYGSGNRDESVFEEPDNVLPGRPHSPPHLGFGRGTHYCVGAALAGLELRVALEELIAAYPTLQLVPGKGDQTYQPVFPFRARNALWVRTRGGAHGDAHR
ncbi:cytochrome P450 [Streptomyces sp. NPDC020681]|uniref:cytochrome P450 n=1 Tax=Streptomyces sp. NPDC020681 TaxID=3365083 RepID=UPI00379B2699